MCADHNFKDFLYCDIKQVECMSLKRTCKTKNELRSVEPHIKWLKLKERHLPVKIVFEPQSSFRKESLWLRTSVLGQQLRSIG